MAEGIVCALLVIGAAVVPFMVWATGDRSRRLVRPMPG
jgi:hypothetical protein